MSDGTSGSPADLEHRRLRSALEFAVLMAAEGQKRRPPITVPDGLKPFLGAASSSNRIPNRALGSIRRAIEGDETFRRRLAAGALPELVDEIGRLWLQRPDGWESSIDRVLTAERLDGEIAELRALVKRADDRREAAERAQARVEAELASRDRLVSDQRDEADELRADVAKLSERVEELRLELTDARLEVRHARDREQAAVDRLTAAESGREAAVRARDEAQTVRDDALAGRVETSASVAEIAAAAAEATTLAERLRSLLPSAGADVDASTRSAHRTPMSLPGGILSSSADAAAFFVRSEAAIVVDGYNVTKSLWPARTLEQQRDLLLDATENLARRYGTDLTVIFDGADVVGAHARRRRMVRVVFSPDGVIADDIIRDEVRRLPVGRAVVVVTDDNEIIRDVRADGANTLSANAFAAIL
ncbi:MAG: NYN domain-containing protein [Actinomycetota bacterium]